MLRLMIYFYKRLLSPLKVVKHAVLISLKDYSALIEKSYLLGCPHNAKLQHDSLTDTKAFKILIFRCMPRIIDQKYHLLYANDEWQNYHLPCQYHY